MLRLFAFTLFLLPLFVSAQEPPARISRELAALVNVPALISEAGPGTGSHDASTVLQFDKRIFVSTNAGKGKAEMYLYINTRTGSVATRTGRAGTLGDGSLDVNDEHFTLTYYNPTGLIYNYYNRKKRGILEHYVSSLNTEVVAYAAPQGFERTTVHKNGGQKQVLEQHFDATPYKASGASAPTLFLCGGPAPPGLLLKRFVGFAGIGYVKTDRGIQMVVEMTSPTGGFKAERWEDVDLSLDKSIFKSVEAEMYGSFYAGNDREREKMAGKVYTGHCADLEERIRALELAKLAESRRQMDRSASGNLINDAAARNALASTIDFETELEIGLLEADLRVCKIEAASGGRLSQSAAGSIARTMEGKARLEKMLAEVRAIDQRFPNDKVKAHAEKMKVFVRAQADLRRSGR